MSWFVIPAKQIAAVRGKIVVRVYHCIDAVTPMGGGGGGGDAASATPPGGGGAANINSTQRVVRCAEVLYGWNSSKRQRTKGVNALAHDPVGHAHVARAELCVHVRVEIGAHGAHEDAALVAGAHNQGLSVDAAPRHRAALRRLVRPKGMHTLLSRISDHAERLSREARGCQSRICA